ncbi:Serine/threonine-protein phosphatase 2A activator 1 [Agyrium rufum]|nr:Serine/threonine-protein phosphatase 2A activator 1 [Agyrium rufum]
MANQLPTLPSSLDFLDSSRSHSFIKPIKRINEGQHVTDFLASTAYRDIMTFLLLLNRAMFPLKAVKGEDGNESLIKTWEVGSSKVICSTTIVELQSLLQRLGSMIDEVPPDPGPRRFGNISFRKWNELLEERVESLLRDHLPEQVLSFNSGSSISPVSELKVYLLGAFGSSQRLDYGTGHELSFLAFLGCIWKLGGFVPDDEPGNLERSIVLGLIDPYLSLVRRLIITYNLEPAGTHGVWGLDDHSFLPYIFGSSQYAPPLEGNQVPLEGSRDGAPSPNDVTRTTVVERERKLNMYFAAIGFIYDVKTGPFWEHSPTLYDISGVTAGWAKVNKGMIKMYNVEVLSKFPVVQHFLFGSLFSFDRDPNAAEPIASTHISSHQQLRDIRGVVPTTKIRQMPVSMPSARPSQSSRDPRRLQASSDRLKTALLRPNPRSSPPISTPSLRSRPSTDQAKAKSALSGKSPPIPSADSGSMLPPMTKAPWAS